MPRPPGFKTSAIRDLFQQLAYTPATARKRLLREAEGLLDEIELGKAYPEAFVVFRVTGYRPDKADESVMLVGDALLADLAVFVQLISESLDLPPASKSRGKAESIDELATRLRVAPRTLRRWHHRGLLFHYVLFGDGSKRLACYEGSLARFERRQGGLMKRATAFSRLEAGLEESIVAEAKAIAATEQLARQQIAARLARKHGRAVETVRAILARHEAAAGTRVFAGRRRTRERERRFVIRAWASGADPGEIAKRLRRDTLTIRRLVNHHRSERLGSIPLAHVTMPTFDLPHAGEVILAPARVRAGLVARTASLDALAALEEWKNAPPLPRPTEEALLAAFNFLKHRVSNTRESSAGHSSDERLDRLETDLRWAALLKRTLAWLAMPSAIGRIEAALSRSLVQRGAESIRTMIAFAVTEVSGAIESVDPTGRQRLERMTAFAVDMALARRGTIEPADHRAGVRHAPNSLLIPDPFAKVLPWQAMFEFPSSRLRALASLEPDARRLIERRFGLVGERPLTVRELAAAEGCSMHSAGRALRAAWRAIKRFH